jgi:nitrate reductase assembly molybdenum cofactor insertion protein NarJ
VETARSKGRNVAELEQELKMGRTALKEAAREWHTFDLESVKRRAVEVFERAKAVRAKVRSAIK